MQGNDYEEVKAKTKYEPLVSEGEKSEKINWKLWIPLIVLGGAITIIAIIFFGIFLYSYAYDHRYDPYPCFSYSNSGNGTKYGYIDCHTDIIDSTSFPKDVSNVESITIKNFEGDIMPDTFDNFINLYEIVVQSSNKYKSISGILFEWGEKILDRIPIGLEIISYSLPDMVESISSHAFYNCKRLETIKFNSNLEDINEDAFLNSSIKEFSFKDPNIFSVQYTTAGGNGKGTNLLRLYKDDFNSDEEITIIPKLNIPFPFMNQETKKRFQYTVKETGETGTFADASIAKFTLKSSSASIISRTFSYSYNIGKDNKIISSEEKRTYVEVINETRFEKEVTTGTLYKLPFLISSTDTLSLTRIVYYGEGENEEQEEMSIFEPSIIFTLIGEPYDNFIVKKAGVYILNVEDGDHTMVLHVKSTGTRWTSASIADKAQEVLVVPRDVWYLSRDALEGMTGLRAIVKDTQTPAIPENCDFGVDAETGRYKHVPVFAVPLDSPPSVAVPDTCFLAGTQIPVLQHALASGEAITVDGQTLTCDRVGYCLHELGLEEGEHTITGGDGTALTVRVSASSLVNGACTAALSDSDEEGRVPYGVYEMNTKSSSHTFKSFVMPPTVKVIFNDAIRYYSVYELQLPHGLKALQERALYPNADVRKIIIPGSLDVCDNSFFDPGYYTTNVESVIFEDGFEKVGDHMFSQNYYLQDVYFNDDIRAIGDFAFYKTQIRDVVFGNKLESIGAYAFSNVSANTITLPSSVRVIGEQAFAGSYLSDVILNEGLKEIGNLAFRECDFSSIHIPKTITKMGDNPFAGVPLSNVTVEDGGIIKLEDNVLYNSQDGSLILYICSDNTPNPLKIASYIKVVGGYAVYKCKKLRNLELCPNVNEVKESSFSYCTNLESIKLNEGLVTIGNYAFSYTNITDLTIPSTVREIKSYAFAYNEKLGKVEISEKSTSIQFGNSVFYHTSVDTFTIPDGMEDLTGTYVFIGAPLSSLTFPYSLWKEGRVEQGFLYDSNIKSICCIVGNDGECPDADVSYYSYQVIEPTCGKYEDGKLVCS